MVIWRNRMIERSRKLEEMFRLHKHLNVEDISVRLWRVSGGFFYFFFFFSLSPLVYTHGAWGRINYWMWPVEEQSSASNWLVFAIISPSWSDTGRQEEAAGGEMMASTFSFKPSLTAVTAPFLQIIIINTLRSTGAANYSHFIMSMKLNMCCLFNWEYI